VTDYETYAIAREGLADTQETYVGKHSVPGAHEVVRQLDATRAPDFGADLNDDGALHQFTAAELVRLAEKLTGAAVAAAYEAGRRSALLGALSRLGTEDRAGAAPIMAQGVAERAGYEAVRLEATSAFQDVLDELAQAHARLAREHEAS
jgi:hypothetical protein